MKKIGFLTRISLILAALLSAACAAAVIGAVLCCRGSQPVLLAVSADAVAHADQLMRSVCQGDFEQAQAMIDGTPDLGMEGMADSEVADMIWQAYIDSLDYELVGEPYPSREGIIQDVKFISLELPTVTEHLGTRARALLQQAMDEAEDVSELYDENNEYRQELVEQVLEEAARQALEEDVRYGYRTIALRLRCRDGQWWALADDSFLKAISGGILD